MIIYPKAKINLGLRVVEKRSDGFHNLESLFVDVPRMTDILEIMESDRLSFSLYGAALDCDKGENICEKAFGLLQQDFKLPGAEIHLYKKIPTGAGLGGGSSDGACTLILLNEIYGLDLTDEVLCSYAARLGSDCPYFILAHRSGGEGYTPAYVQGRGDIIEPFELPALNGLEVRVVDPGIFISTAEAYSGITPSKPGVPLRNLLRMPAESWKESVVNDFESHIFKLHPELQEHKERLYREGAVYASMSGSGSALYGLFPGS
jgi:4-diphosphocytidyl-2-C-methyl-D-erythritol kinase